MRAQISYKGPANTGPRDRHRIIPTAAPVITRGITRHWPCSSAASQTMAGTAPRPRHQVSSSPARQNNRFHARIRAYSVSNEVRIPAPMPTHMIGIPRGCRIEQRELADES